MNTQWHFAISSSCILLTTPLMETFEQEKNWACSHIVRTLLWSTLFNIYPKTGAPKRTLLAEENENFSSRKGTTEIRDAVPENFRALAANYTYSKAQKLTLLQLQPVPVFSCARYYGAFAGVAIYCAVRSAL